MHAIGIESLKLSMFRYRTGVSVRHRIAEHGGPSIHCPGNVP